MVIKADMLRTQIDKEFDNIKPLSALATVSKMVSGETIKEIADRIAAIHKPVKMNYRKKFGLKEVSPFRGNTTLLDKQPSEQYYCFQCKKKITAKVATFCWDNKKRFHGKAYCFNCQKAFPGQH